MRRYSNSCLARTEARHHVPQARTPFARISELAHCTRPLELLKSASRAPGAPRSSDIQTGVNTDGVNLLMCCGLHISVNTAAHVTVCLVSCGQSWLTVGQVKCGKVMEALGTIAGAVAPALCGQQIAPGCPALDGQVALILKDLFLQTALLPCFLQAGRYTSGQAWVVKNSQKPHPSCRPSTCFSLCWC